MKDAKGQLGHCGLGALPRDVDSTQGNRPRARPPPPPDPLTMIVIASGTGHEALVSYGAKIPKIAALSEEMCSRWCDRGVAPIRHVAEYRTSRRTSRRPRKAPAAEVVSIRDMAFAMDAVKAVGVDPTREPHHASSPSAVRSP